jgi:multiple antibiotic resistance protein
MVDTLGTLIRTALLVMAALLPLINPPGTGPIFLSMTPGISEPARTALARRVARNSFVLLVAATLVGSYVLLFFGLSLAVVKIAGGLLVMSAAWHLVRAEGSPDFTIAAASPAASGDDDIGSHSFYPLTFPITIGPGSISVAVTLGAGMRLERVFDVTRIVGALVGMACVSLVVYLCYRFAGRMLRALGRTGSVVLLRLSAFILLAVGVQIFCDGVVARFGLDASLR